MFVSCSVLSVSGLGLSEMGNSLAGSIRVVRCRMKVVEDGVLVFVSCSVSSDSGFWGVASWCLSVVACHPSGRPECDPRQVHTRHLGDTAPRLHDSHTLTPSASRPPSWSVNLTCRPDLVVWPFVPTFAADWRTSPTLQRRQGVPRLVLYAVRLSEGKTEHSPWTLCGRVFGFPSDISSAPASAPVLRQRQPHPLVAPPPAGRPLAALPPARYSLAPAWCQLVGRDRGSEQS